MAFSFELSFAGIPFVSDVSPIVRQEARDTALRDPQRMPPRKHQPLADLVDELNRIIPFRYMQDLIHPFTSRNLIGLAQSHRSQDPRILQTHIGEWYYPVGAARFSVFRGLATSQMMKQMLTTTGGTQAETFIMKAVPQGNPAGTDATYEITTSMYMLPPRPLAEHGGSFDGLYLITLVDQRYYFPGTPATLQPSTQNTWSDLINAVASNLGITLTFSSIDANYSAPEVDSFLWTNFENAAVLLDALAYNVGRTVVRNLDGTFALKTPSESATTIATNRGANSNVVRTAGGDIFASGTSLPGGDLFNTKNSIIPSSISVTFPKYVYGADPVPHFINPRLNSGHTSVWTEDSYGDVHAISIQPASGGQYVSGLTGTSTQTIRSTAKAMYPTEAAAVSGGIPDNSSGLTALAMNAAIDRYSWLAVAGLDETYPGTFLWTPEGIHDIIWTYSDRTRQGLCRVVRNEWNAFVDTGQWNNPAMSGSSVVSGIGGRSVAQTWRDIGPTSGSLMFGGVNLISVGSGLTAAVGAVTSGGIREVKLSSNATSSNATYSTLTDDGIWLNSASQYLDVVLGDTSTVQLPWTLDYADTGSDFSSNADGQTNNTSPVHMIQGITSATKVRGIRHVSVFNADAATHTVTVQVNDGGTPVPLVSIAVPSGSTLLFDYHTAEWKLIPDTNTVPLPTGPGSGGGGTGGGSEISVGLNMPAGWTVTGSPVKNTGTFVVKDPLTSKGDLLTNDGSKDVRHGIGSANQFLGVDTTSTDNLNWRNINVGIAMSTGWTVTGSPTYNGTITLTAPLTTTGDIYCYSNQQTRLGVGSDGYFLTADSTQATGLNWTKPSLTGPSPRLQVPYIKTTDAVTRKWYFNAPLQMNGVTVGTGLGSFSNDLLTATLMYRTNGTIDQIGIYVNTLPTNKNFNADIQVNNNKLTNVTTPAGYDMTMFMIGQTVTGNVGGGTSTITAIDTTNNTLTVADNATSTALQSSFTASAYMKVRFGFYNVIANNYPYPQTLQKDLGELIVTATGRKTITLSPAFALTDSCTWLAINLHSALNKSDGTNPELDIEAIDTISTTLETFGGLDDGTLWSNIAAGKFGVAWRIASTYGAMPATFPGTEATATLLQSNTVFPLIGFTFSV